jgi:glutathione synthase/RimK-type ligase-like ATP-grasp enzyme
MRYLFSLKERGFTVINDPEVLYLTSNKLECALRLQDHFPHPRTWLINKHIDMNRYRVFGRACDEGYEHFIVKPETSISQGASVLKFDKGDIDGYGDLDSFIERVPGNIVVLQERVPYSAIYRVVVIGGHALPYSFVDRPTTEKWKVSVCLNRETMEFVDNPSPDLLRLAENIQQFIGGEINFIDIFEITPNSFVVSEINTACNLHIHEMLAKRADHPKWNIHYRIDNYLVNRAMEGG